jgi:hypothetical protein
MGRLKFVVGDGVSVNRKGLRQLRGRIGTVVQIGPDKGEYGVEFEDGQEPSLVYIEAMKLDRLQETQTPTAQQIAAQENR